MLKLSFYLCLAILIVGQFSLIAGSADTKFYFFDILVPLFATFGLVYFLLVKRSLKIPKYFVPFIIFCFIAICSLLFALSKFSPADVIVGSFYLIRFVSYLFSGIVIYNLLKVGKISDNEIYRAVVISGVFLAVAGFVQLYLLPDFTVLDPSLGWDPHKNRLAATFFDPNFVGQYLAVCLVYFFDRYYKLKKISFADGLIFLVMLIAFFLTFSRSAWAMLGVIVFIYGALKSKSLLMVGLLIAFCAYFAVPRVQTRISGATDPSDSAKLRFVSWQNAWKIAKDNLWVGVGFNTYKFAQIDYGLLDVDSYSSHAASGTDSSLLLVLTTTGILGLLVYLTGLLLPVLEKGRDKIAYLAVCGGLLVGSLFINSLFFPQIMFLYFITLARYSFSRT